MMEAKIKQIYSPRLASRIRGLVPDAGSRNQETRRPPTRQSALDTNNLNVIFNNDAMMPLNCMSRLQY